MRIEVRKTSDFYFNDTWTAELQRPRSFRDLFPRSECSIARGGNPSETTTEDCGQCSASERSFNNTLPEVVSLNFLATLVPPGSRIWRVVKGCPKSTSAIPTISLETPAAAGDDADVPPRLAPSPANKLGLFGASPEGELE